MKILFVLAAACGFLFVNTTASALGDPAAGQAKSITCAACHGPDGNSISGEWPKLAAQHPGYLAKQLREFRDGVRVNTIMRGMTMRLSDEDINDLAAYFSSQAIRYGIADPELVEQGEALYRGGDLVRGVPACSGCHGPSGLGNKPANFPRLAGQHAEYVVTQMRTYRTMERNNDINGMMRGVATNISDEQIEAVASFIQGLRP